MEVLPPTPFIPAPSHEDPPTAILYPTLSVKPPCVEAPIQPPKPTLDDHTVQLTTHQTTMEDLQSQITALQQKLTDLSTLVQTLIPVNRLPK